MAGGIPLSPTQPSDPYAWAVQQATREYPRLAQYPPMRLTYNPKREGYSETFEPHTDDPNPFPGNWTVEMGNSPYYKNRASWPGLVALESLHMMQKVDPHYQALTAQLQQSLTQQQLAEIQTRKAQRPDLFQGDKRTLDQLLSQVYVPEIIRGRMFAPLFHQVEGAPVGGWNEYHTTPEQEKIIDQIEQYMRSSGTSR